MKIINATPTVFPIPDVSLQWVAVEYNFCKFCGSSIYREKDQRQWRSWTWNGWIHWRTLEVSCQEVTQPDWVRYFK